MDRLTPVIPEPYDRPVLEPGDRIIVKEPYICFSEGQPTICVHSPTDIEPAEGCSPSWTRPPPRPVRERFSIARWAASAEPWAFRSMREPIDDGVRIGPSPGRGTGVFATRNFSRGEIIVASWAIGIAERRPMVRALYAPLSRWLPGNELMIRSVLDEIMFDPELAAQVQSLTDGTGEELPRGVIDIARLDRIAVRTAYNTGSHLVNVVLGRKVGSGCTGLWYWPALMNHECSAKAEWTTFGDLHVVRAMTAIAEGEEVTVPYTQRFSKDPDRFRVWGFTCNCSLCRGESTLNGAAWKNASELLGRGRPLADDGRHLEAISLFEDGLLALDEWPETRDLCAILVLELHLDLARSMWAVGRPLREVRAEVEAMIREAAVWGFSAEDLVAIYRGPRPEIAELVGLRSLPDSGL
jgi:hypothetical protein